MEFENQSTNDIPGYGQIGGQEQSSTEAAGTADATANDENSYGRIGGDNAYGQVNTLGSDQHAGPQDEPSEGAEEKEEGLRTKAMDSFYQGEQHSAAKFRRPGDFNKYARNPGARFTSAKTNYLRPEEQAKAAVSVENGKLMRGGAPLDTRDATDIGTAGADEEEVGKGKHIYAMTPDKQVRSMDAWGAHTEELKDKDTNSYGLGMVNHSSLAAVKKKNGDMKSGAVAAAGEIAAEDGKLTQVTDASGHYKPDNKMTRQGLENFLNQGVDMHDVALKLSDKERGGKNHLHASAREFLAEKDHDYAEDNMRDRRAKMRGEIEQKREEFEARQASGKMSFAGQTVAATPARLDPRTRAPRMKKSQDLIGLFEGMY